MDLLVQLLGAAVVLVVLQDVFFTVLFPGSGHGLVRRPLSRWVWAVFRRLPYRSSQSRRRLLSYSGPVQIAVTIVVWLLLLVVGWAMVFQPALGNGVVASSGTTDTGWAAAVYFSGFALTTLGTGDLVPSTGAYRLLTVTESAVGFVTISLVVTYFLSVYNALTARKTAAARLHHRTYGTGDGVRLLTGLAEDGDLRGAQDEVARLADFVQQLFETHRSYPVLRYFHFPEVSYALPRVLITALDLATVISSTLDPQRYGRLLHGPATAQLTTASQQLLHELVPRAANAAPDGANERQWRQRHAAVVRMLSEAQVSLAPDSLDAYVRRRSTWDRQLRDLADATLYDWKDIEPASDPQAALIDEAPA